MNWEITNQDQYKEVVREVCPPQGAKYSLIWGLSLYSQDLEQATYYRHNNSAIALQTHANKPLIFTDLKLPEAKNLAALIETTDNIKEIVGTKESVEFILDNLRSSHPGYPEIVMSQKIYKCSKLIPFDRNNKMIKATNVHLKTVKEWFRQFLIDTHINLNPSDQYIQELATTRIEREQVFILIVDGTPVSMASMARPTNESITVNGVFTPIERRGNGYACECTSKLTELLLKEYKYCTLYTDSTNPTSNKIYTKVGYEFICESLHYKIKE